MKRIEEAAAWLAAREKICILTHRSPDGDCTGSAIALCLGLRQLGKDAWIYPNPQFTQRYQGRLSGLVAEGVPVGAAVVAVDVATEALFPMGAEALAGCVELCLDHHPSNTGYAKEALVMPELAATGELIWELLLAMGVSPDRDMAEAVYLAVSTDTGCFRFANTSAHTFRTVAGCVDHGAVIAPINRELFEVRALGRLRLEARLLERARFYGGGKVAVCLLPQAWVEELGLSEDQLDGIAGFPRTIQGVEVGVMIRDREAGKAKLSVRTAPGWDASAYCAQLGGGGHSAAAGAAVNGTLEEGRDAILGALVTCGVLTAGELDSR